MRYDLQDCARVPAQPRISDRLGSVNPRHLFRFCGIIERLSLETPLEERCAVYRAVRLGRTWDDPVAQGEISLTVHRRIKFYAGV